MDLADQSQLIAFNRTNDEICEAIGADELIYLPLQALIDSCMQARTDYAVDGFEVGVFSGQYITYPNSTYSSSSTSSPSDDGSDEILHGHEIEARLQLEDLDFKDKMEVLSPRIEHAELQFDLANRMSWDELSDARARIQRPRLALGV